MMISGMVSDRTGGRALYIIFWSVVGAVGYLVIVVGGSTLSNSVKYGMTFLVRASSTADGLTSQIVPASYSIAPIAIALCSVNAGSETKRVVNLAMLNMCAARWRSVADATRFGQCFAVWASKSYPTSDAPRYVYAFSAVCAAMFVNVRASRWPSAADVQVLSLSAYTLLQVRENRRRDRLYGKPVPGELCDPAEADHAHGFRYAF